MAAVSMLRGTKLTGKTLQLAVPGDSMAPAVLPRTPASFRNLGAAATAVASAVAALSGGLEPLTYTAYDYNTASGTSVSSASISYNAGQPIVVIAGFGASGTRSISDTAGLTWSLLGSNTANGGGAYVWVATPGASGSTVITVGTSAATAYAFRVMTHTGAGAPVLSGNGTVAASTAFSQSITPTSSGSLLWMAVNDFQGRNPAATAGTDCVYEQYYNSFANVTLAAIRPTTQPRTDAAAFTLAGTSTASSQVSWVAFEVPQGAAGGATQNLAAAASAVASATADLQKTASLAAAAAAQASATAALSAGVNVSLAADAQGLASATAALTHGVPLAAAAVAVASASGALSHGVPLSAAAAAVATASGQIALAVTLGAAALAQATASAQAAVAKGLAAAAAGQASASADLQVNSGTGLAAAAQGVASATAVLSLTVPLGASAQATALAGAAVQLQVRLSAAALASAQAQGSLSITVNLAAAAQGQATATAALPTLVSLAAGAQAIGQAQADLRVVAGWVPAAPRGNESRPIAPAGRSPQLAGGTRQPVLATATRAPVGAGRGRAPLVQTRARRSN